MNVNKKRVTIAAMGIAAITLLSALSHAGSRQYTDTSALNTGLDEATTIALTSVGGALIEAELEFDDDRAIWEIEIVDEANQVVSVEIDGTTGEIVNTEHSDDDAPGLSSTISMEQAIELVRGAENGVIIEVELEEENDTVIWEIEVLDEQNKESEFRVDGITGELLQ